MTTTLISGRDKMNCINNDKTYNRSVIMKLASRVYRFEKRFNKSLTWGEVLHQVWQAVIKLMTSCRQPKKEMTYINIEPKKELIGRVSSKPVNPWANVYFGC